MKKPEKDLPPHYYNLKPQRGLATNALVARLAPRDSRVGRAERAVGFTLRLFAEIMPPQAFQLLMRKMTHGIIPLTIYTDSQGKITLDNYLPTRAPLPNFPVLVTSLPDADSQSHDIFHRVARRIHGAGSIVFSQSPASGLPRFIIEQLLRDGQLSPADGRLTVVDLCGAPGNKTFNLIDALPGISSLRAIINDPKPHRLARVAERLLSFGFVPTGDNSFRKKTQFHDSAVIHLTNFDATDQLATERACRQFFSLPPQIVLADVPCPGDGRIFNSAASAVAPQPKTPDDTRLQQQILATALSLARPYPRGAVVYSTCSLNPLVNESVIEAVVGVNRRFSCLDIEPATPGILSPALGGFREYDFRHVKGIRALPHTDMQEGFFCSVVIKD